MNNKPIDLVFEKSWHEDDYYKTGWFESEWSYSSKEVPDVNEDDYELLEVIQTDKYDRPILALFRLKEFKNKEDEN